MSTTNDQLVFFAEIKSIIRQRQYEALRQVNASLIALYLEIGKRITQAQKEKGWGKSVVELLAKDLQNEFPGVQGYSARNLWLMRNFYTEYLLSPNLQPLVAEISWAKNVVIMQKCKDPLEREFYIRITKKFGWTKDVLINNIENQAYGKYLTNQTNFDETVAEKYRQQAKLAVKDEYNFEFLEMGVEHSEAELETALVNNIRAFLAEMGGDFAFIGNQFHLPVDDNDFYIDLLLFHRKLRCLIAIELKIGDFKPEYAGKMQFYLEALDQTVKNPDENPSIGIVICKGKQRTIVEYTLKPVKSPIGVSTYTTRKSLPANLKALLPSPAEIAARLKILSGE